MKSLILTFLAIGMFFALLGLLSNADEADRRFTNFAIFCFGSFVLVVDAIMALVWMFLNR